MDKLQNILSLVDEYITEKHSKRDWKAGEHWVQYSGPYFTSDEYLRSVKSLLSEWLVLGGDAPQYDMPHKVPSYLDEVNIYNIDKYDLLNDLNSNLLDLLANPNM